MYCLQLQEDGARNAAGQDVNEESVEEIDGESVQEVCIVFS